jgi:hypothetical protein
MVLVIGDARDAPKDALPDRRRHAARFETRSAAALLSMT